MYWLCHADPEKLSLGDDDITLKDLDNLLNEVPVGKTGVGLVILNACRTAEPGSLGSFLKSFHDRGYCGIIATEERTLDSFANPFGLGLLRGIHGREGTVASIATGLRRQSLPSACSTRPIARPACTSPAPTWPPPSPVWNRSRSLRPRRDRPRHRDPPGPADPAASRRPAHPPLASTARGYALLAPGHLRPGTPRLCSPVAIEDVERFALLLDHSETRILVLHGESGVGKSSFLRAGVLPYLEDECIGYRLLRDRSVPPRRRSIAGAVRPLDRRPDRPARPGPLRFLQAAVCVYHSQREPGRGRPGRQAWPGSRPGLSTAGPSIGDLRAALASDPDRLGRGIRGGRRRAAVHARRGHRPGRGDVHPRRQRRAGCRPRPLPRVGAPGRLRGRPR